VRSARLAASRPRPPAGILDEESEATFVPARDMPGWVRLTFLNSESPLYDSGHDHLSEASIGFLWTNVENKSQGKWVLATAGLGPATGKPWNKGRQDQQLREWFGSVPDFVITIDAHFADSASDLQFCALVEHELLHCAYRLDKEGAPRINPETGLPVWAIRPHDLEEFDSVARRYGEWGADVASFRQALEDGPTLAAVFGEHTDPAPRARGLVLLSGGLDDAD
jgi:hypothetical protein